MKKRFWRNAGILLIFLLLLESVLRLVGFGTVPCYRSSRIYEYEVKPNQDFHRFGNHFYTNSYGMRSQEVKSDFRHILKFGDSVLNGGAGTDQSDLASSRLQVAVNQSFDSVQVLNVSAGSWGPGNAFMWMQSHGDFDAALIVLLFNSHDWSDFMTFRDVVGNTPFYPTQNPALAISDAISWVTSRYFEKTEWDKLPLMDGIDPRLMNYRSGWRDFINYADSTEIPLLVYHHADKSEMVNGEWNAEGKELKAFLTENGVKTISGLKSGLDEGDYHDEIHPNAAGQAKIEKAIQPEVLKILARQDYE